jgi:uncharacterized membrane protein
MEFFQMALIAATLLCSLVAGFVFAFTVVVMPGIQGLNDREFIRAFIQNDQPLFVFVWVGSVVALVVAAVLGIGQLDGGGRLLLLIATGTYVLGVQVPTIAINVPLNNTLQTLDVDRVKATTHADARREFEPRWNRWNTIRTALASVTSALLMIVLLRL